MNNKSFLIFLKIKGFKIKKLFFLAIKVEFICVETLVRNNMANFFTQNNSKFISIASKQSFPYLTLKALLLMQAFSVRESQMFDLFFQNKKGNQR